MLQRQRAMVTCTAREFFAPSPLRLVSMEYISTVMVCPYQTYLLSILRYCSVLVDCTYMLTLILSLQYPSAVDLLM